MINDISFFSFIILIQIFYIFIIYLIFRLYNHLKLKYLNRYININDVFRYYNKDPYLSKYEDVIILDKQKNNKGIIYVKYKYVGGSSWTYSDTLDSFISKRRKIK
jgi:hypothetical protein